MNPKVDAYLNRNPRWLAELTELRRIALASGLAEDLKWGVPAYTLDGANIALLHVFKEYCAVLFVKGALLQDPDGLLITQTENVQAARQVRFRTADEVRAQEPAVAALLQQAIQLERAGAKVEFKKASEFAVPAEFQAQLDADSALREAFAKLTPGRQRAYLLFFAGAKQPKTREARVAKCAPQILAGKGLDD